MFVPLCALICVLCRCCYRYRTERRGIVRRRGLSSTHALSRNNNETELEMAANSRADLPSYDDIMKDSSGTFLRIDSSVNNDENSEEPPPPSYDTVIGSWTDQPQTSVT